jgi:hypothetical protein
MAKVRPPASRTYRSMRAQRRRFKDSLTDSLVSTTEVERVPPAGATCSRCGQPFAPGELARFVVPPPGWPSHWMMLHEGCPSPLQRAA